MKIAWRESLPVLAGYIVLGFGYGLIMKSNNFHPVFIVAMSVLVYAGSMQYAAVPLLNSHASIFTIALTTLTVNTRHLFYGLSMIERYKTKGFKKWYLMFSLTDETYSLVCQKDKDINYCFKVSLLDHLYWIAGTVLGVIFGSIFTFNTTGVDFVLTALFLVVFCEQWLSTKDHFGASCGIVVTLICRFLFGTSGFLIPSMFLILIVLLGKRRLAR